MWQTDSIRQLSDRLVEAQRPIRILDAIKWDASIAEAFFAAKCREQPPVDRAYYESRPLGFDPDAKRQEFHALERDISRLLGQFNPIGVIMRRMCREYRTVLRMLEARGTPEFVGRSQELYGSASDVFHSQDPSLADLGRMMSDLINNLGSQGHLCEEPRTIPAPQAVELLQARLERAFGQFPDHAARVVLSDGIVADASAGSDYIKLRAEATFNERDLRLLEVHEGWVHLGTTFNGQSQPVCTFLSKGPPSSTVTQEGLALLMELIAFTSHPDRLRRLTFRITAIDMAENGATFLDVFRALCEQGLTEQDSYQLASRVFRGSLPACGPFTKDICYSKGFVLVYNYVQLAVRKGMLHRIPLLFCGKTTLEDMRLLAQLVDEGVVIPPRFLPPQFADLSALTAWMAYSNFLNHLDLARIEADYANIL